MEGLSCGVTTTITLVQDTMEGREDLPNFAQD